MNQQLVNFGFRGLFIATLSMVLCACSTYRAQPLSPTAVASALTPPTWPELQVRIAELHHVRLPTEAIDPAGPFSPEQIALVAIVANPGLRAIRSERALAAAQLLQAGILPNPQLSVGADLAVNSPDGLATPGKSLGLAWDLSGLITRGAKKSAAAAHLEQVALDIAWQEWVIAEGAKQAAIKFAAAEARLELTRELLRTLDEHHALLEQALRSGATTVWETNTASTAKGDAQRQVFDGERDLVRLRLQLNRMLGLPPEAAVAIRVARWTTRLDIATELTTSLTDQRLDLIALRRGYDSQEEGLRAAVLAQFPKIGINLARATDTSDVRSLTLGVTIDLPIFDRNQGVIASETATRQKLFDEYTQRVFEARSDCALAQADAAALSRMIILTDEQEKELQTHAIAIKKALDGHVIDRLSANASIVQLLQKRIESLLLRQELAETAIVVELAVGCLLTTDATTHTAPRDQGKP